MKSVLSDDKIPISLEQDSAGAPNVVIKGQNGALDVSSATVSVQEDTALDVSASTVTVTDDGSFNVSGTVSVQESTALDVSGATVDVQEATALDVSASTVTVTDNGSFNIGGTVSVQESTALDVSGATVDVQEASPLDVSGATVTVTDDANFDVNSVSGTVSVQESSALDVSAKEVDVDINSQTFSPLTVTDDGNFDVNATFTSSAATTRDTGKSITTSQEISRLNTEGRDRVSLGIDATNTNADFRIDASHDGSDWVENFIKYEQTDTVRDTLEIGINYVRVYVSDTAASGTADVLIGAS